MLKENKSDSQEKDEEYYSGCLYDRQDFLRFQLAKTFLSRVSIPDEYVEKIKTLAAEGLVVYAIKQESKLNSIIVHELAGRNYLPKPLYCHGMYMTFWQPLPMMLKFFWSSFLRKLGKTKKAHFDNIAFLERQVVRKKSIIFHLGESEFIENSSSDDAVSALIKVQQQVDFPIFIVPVMVAYGRRREKEKESLINILFGQSEHTGPLRRLITFMRYSNKAFIVPAEPVNLIHYLSENKDLSERTMLRDLRGELIDRIEEEKTSIVGPVLKSRAELISMVLSDATVNQFIDEYAAKEKKEQASVKKDARRYLYEIAADYNEMFVELWDKLLTWLWNTVYDGVLLDMEGLAKIRTISRKMPFVIIPCHRSHIDYLLLSYVFYKNNIQLPFVAAGNNMSFFPMGYVFRKSGAFFLRRSFRGNIVYGKVFAKYVATLLREGLPLEFFIEGGRSRTGKMVMPRYGLLSMVLQAYEEKYCDNLAAIPIYIGYDRVIEEKSYLKELAGIPKVQENTADMIKSSKILRKRFGRVYINIGEPIIMKDYLEQREKQVSRMNLEERQSLYRKIGYEIVLEINKVSIVTPFSMVACGLLSHDRRGISHEDLTDVLNEFYEYLFTKEIKFAVTFANQKRAIADALNIFASSGIISKIEAEEDEVEEMQEVVYSLEDDKRLNLEYYKNNILHFFIPLCFVATSMVNSDEDDVMSLTRIMGDYKFLKRLLWNEFIFDERKDDVDEVNDVLAYLHNRKMIAPFERDGLVWIEVKGKGKIKLKSFAGLIHNYLESSWIVLRSCLYLKKTRLTEKDWLKKIRALGDRMYSKGEVLRAESLSQSNYTNVILFLKDADIISTAVEEEKGEKNEVTYKLTENRAEMEVLRRRLFKFL
ncbi:MAG: 1-acyl-sn-glycerol-3-phosphate acyltransferase [Smithella sp.]